MKINKLFTYFLNCVAIFSLGISSLAFGAARGVQIETQKVGEAMHWVSSEPIVLKQGEDIELTANHKLEGGFEFHGLSIPTFHVSEQVNRNQPKVISIHVPADMKAGEYEIGCQFHPKHVGLKFTVVAAEAPKKSKKSKKK